MAARSAIETVAVTWELIRLLNSGDKIEIDQIKKIAIGSRIDGLLSKQTNILTLITKLDKELTGIEQDYKWLCETTHPNFMGVLAMFCQDKLDRTPPEAVFGVNPHFPSQQQGDLITKLTRFAMKFYVSAVNDIKMYEH